MLIRCKSIGCCYLVATHDLLHESVGDEESKMYCWSIDLKRSVLLFVAAGEG